MHDVNRSQGDHITRKEVINLIVNLFLAGDFDADLVHLERDILREVLG